MLHPAVFSYSLEASVKGPAENDTVLLLVEEILQDGFVTGGDVLLVIQADRMKPQQARLLK